MNKLLKALKGGITQRELGLHRDCLGTNNKSKSFGCVRQTFRGLKHLFTKDLPYWTPMVTIKKALKRLLCTIENRGLHRDCPCTKEL